MCERAWCNSDQKSVRDAEAVKVEQQRIFNLKLYQTFQKITDNYSTNQSG